MNKKIILSVILTMSLITSSTSASMLENIKKTLNKAALWKSKHLEDIDFKHVYPKAVYKKSYFGFAITGAAIVGAGAFSYFTAGAGAPAAATGVGAVASWAAGGGAGSYMAGLSMIGGMFGGNATLGAAILNGISLGTIGGGVGVTTGAAFKSMAILGKVGVITSVTASALDGIFYFYNAETQRMEYKVRVAIPKDLGGKRTRKLVTNIYDTIDEIQDTIIEENELKEQKLYELIEEYNKKATILLQEELLNDDNQEDLLVLGIIAWNNNEQVLFDKAISKISPAKLDNIGFLDYLYGLQELYKGNNNATLLKLQNSLDENSYAIEPVLLYVSLLGNQEFIENEVKILTLVEDASNNFDSDKYATRYGLTPLYYRLATFYFIHKRYSKAEEYYTNAKEEMGVLQRNFFGEKMLHIIDLGIANSLHEQGKTKKSKEVYHNIMSNIDYKEKQQMREQYLGNR